MYLNGLRLLGGFHALREEISSRKKKVNNNSVFLM